MHSTVQNKELRTNLIMEMEGCAVDERIYKAMGRAGALSIILGVVSIVVGLTSGVMLLVSGGRLLVGKSKILF